MAIGAFLYSAEMSFKALVAFTHAAVMDALNEALRQLRYRKVSSLMYKPMICTYYSSRDCQRIHLALLIRVTEGLRRLNENNCVK